MFLRLVNQLSRQESMAENLEAVDQMTWAGRMNNIREQAAEMVNAEICA